jgi:sigma-B regulation protein RsbU (phosphoserine phosphatase)
MIEHMGSQSSRSTPGRRKVVQGSSDIPDIERQLRETIERYELIFKATNDVLYELDLQTGNVIWNEALTTQYGYDRTARVGKLEWWAEHIHPDDALQLEHKLTDWFEGKADTWQAEYRFRKANGQYVYIRDRGMVQRTSDGLPLRIIGSFLDISQQKQLDRAKDEFISLVSHQLRTPLSVIRMYSEMLTNGLFGELNSSQEEHVRQITDASIRLIQLVGDILNISRAELGHIVSKPVPTNANLLLQKQIQEILPLASRQGKVVRFEPDSKLGTILLDRIVFDQIVQNLLTNALRYTKENHGYIEIKFTHDKRGYLLSVSDNGIGIPKNAQPHIFERFYRADNTVNIQEHGTGLGLYMVKIMTDTLGGDIWFESAIGKGSTFYVQLPELPRSTEIVTDSMPEQASKLN